jgi:hypothetical protein
MAIVPPPPNNVWDCSVLTALRAITKPGDGTAEKAQLLIETASPLLDLISAGPFKDYTLHNRDHARKLLHLASHILQVETIERLSCLDLLVIIYASYIHDLGMSLTATERERIISSQEFIETVEDWQEVSDALRTARGRLNSSTDKDRFPLEAEIYQLQEAALALYLRCRHAQPTRYRELITQLKSHSNRPDLFEHRGVSFEEPLIQVCASHNLETGVLAEVLSSSGERFPRRLAIGGAYLNTQFCAGVLRLVDILDFDRERTPRILFESLGISSRTVPGSELSIREWQKHLAVHTVEINEDEIIFSADAHHPVIEKTIRDFCHVIEREIRDTLTVLRHNTSEIATRYNLELPISVRSRVRSVGYVFKDMALSLNQPRIMSLLMGERLYANPAVAVRELVENAIDACSARQRLEGDGYSARIGVRLWEDDSGARWIEVQDNGIGMDEYVLSEFFLKLGNSYYGSPEFSRLIGSGRVSERFVPISRFGIGLVSVFLLGDTLEVCTKSGFSPRNDALARRMRIERLGTLAFVTETDSGETGTLVRVRLKPSFADPAGDFLNKLPAYLKSVVVRPRFPISVELLESPFVLKGDFWITMRPNARDFLASNNLEMAILDIGRWSNRLSGRVALVFRKTEGGGLSHLHEGRYLRIGKGGIDPLSFLSGFGGNRLTVNGLTMTIKRLARLLAKGKNRLALLFDLDVVGDEAVTYDVSRERVTSAGRHAIVAALEEALFNGLRDIGILDRLEVQTRRLVDLDLRRLEAEARQAGRFVPFPADSHLNAGDPVEILESVAPLLPEGKWPKDLHKSIAKKLSISNGLALRAINTILQQKRTDNAPIPTSPDSRGDGQGLVDGPGFSTSQRE